MPTQLDYVKLFVDAVDATTSVNHEGNVGSLKNAGKAPKIFIHTPEFVDINTHLKETTYRYLMDWDFLTEATLTTALVAMISNIDKLRRRAAIAGYTKPATLVRAELTSIGLIKKGKGKWGCESYIEVTWSES